MTPVQNGIIPVFSRKKLGVLEKVDLDRFDLGGVVKKHKVSDL